MSSASDSFRFQSFSSKVITVDSESNENPLFDPPTSDGELEKNYAGIFRYFFTDLYSGLQMVHSRNCLILHCSYFHILKISQGLTFSA